MFRCLPRDINKNFKGALYTRQRATPCQLDLVSMGDPPAFRARGSRVPPPQKTHQVCGTVPHCWVGNSKFCLYDNSWESGFLRARQWRREEKALVRSSDGM